MGVRVALEPGAGVVVLRRERERGEEEKIWGSMVKQALKRRNPGFSEAFYGFRSFGKLLDEAEPRKLIKLDQDEKSGGVTIRSVSTDD